jgi:hypothetical protein
MCYYYSFHTSMKLGLMFQAKNTDWVNLRSNPLCPYMDPQHDHSLRHDSRCKQHALTLTSCQSFLQFSESTADLLDDTCGSRFHISFCEPPHEHLGQTHSLHRTCTKHRTRVILETLGQFSFILGIGWQCLFLDLQYLHIRMAAYLT